MTNKTHGAVLPPSAEGLSLGALDRRGFLVGISATLGAVPLSGVVAAAPVTNAGSVVAGTPARRAIHQELAYLDQDGVGVVYDAPRGNQATRDYVNRLTQEEFLRRHWFT